MRVVAHFAIALSMLMPVSVAQARDGPVPGTITTAVDDPDGRTPIDAVFDDAVQRALLSANFVVLPGADHGRYVAKLAVSHRRLGVVETRAGGDSPSFGLASFAATLPSHKSELHDLAETRLEVRIFRRGEQQAVWRGAALTTAVDGTVSGQPSVVAGKLANALFRQFPMTADTPIGVP